MSFSDVKKEIFEAAKTSGKTTFSESAFNKLTSALVNEPGYEVKVTKTKAGEVTEEVIKPIEGFRKSVIGGIASSVGADDAEVAKAINNYQFPASTPWYPVVSEAVTTSMEAGKAFTFLTKSDMQATLKIKEEKEAVKMVGAPGSNKDDKKPVLYGAHRRIKSESTCPKSLRKDK